MHLHELQSECEICFLTNSTFVFHSDLSEKILIVFDQTYLTNLNKLSEKLYISTNSSRAPPSVRV